MLLSGIRQASAIAVKHGLTPVLHQHCGTYVEFEDEVERILADTVDDGLQLCIDTGHFIYAGVEPVRFFAEHRDRTAYLHFKDINPIVHQKVLSDGVAFFDAISLGIFCPVGQGMVDFGALAKAAREWVRRPRHDRAGPRFPRDDDSVGGCQGQPRLPARHRNRQLDCSS